MKKLLWLTAALAVGTLLLAGCAEKDPNAFCEENGGQAIAEEGGEATLCMFDDGSYCEAKSFAANDCKAGEIIYNTIDEEAVEEPEEEIVEISFSDEDIKSAKETIVNSGFWARTLKVNNIKIDYMWDEKAGLEQKYCKELDPSIDECIVMESEFFVPEQEVEVAGGLEENQTASGYQWYLGRIGTGEWKIITFGY